MSPDDYRSLIRSIVVRPGPVNVDHGGSSVLRVERATTLADALAGRPASALPPVAAEVSDVAGHRRPVYRPLLVYAHLAAADAARVNLGVVEEWLDAIDLRVP